MLDTVVRAALAIFMSMRPWFKPPWIYSLCFNVSCKVHWASCNLETGKSFGSKNPVTTTALGQFVKKLPEHGLIAPYTENKQLEGLSFHMIGVWETKPGRCVDFQFWHVNRFVLDSIWFIFLFSVVCHVTLKREWLGQMDPLEGAEIPPFPGEQMSMLKDWVGGGGGEEKLQGFRV